jgi:hypothetical protein
MHKNHFPKAASTTIGNLPPTEPLHIAQPGSNQPQSSAVEPCKPPRSQLAKTKWDVDGTTMCTIPLPDQDYADRPHYDTPTIFALFSCLLTKIFFWSGQYLSHIVLSNFALLLQNLMIMKIKGGFGFFGSVFTQNKIQNQTRTLYSVRFFHFQTQNCSCAVQLFSVQFSFIF